MAKLVLLLAAMLAMTTSIASAQKEVLVQSDVDLDNETNSSLDIDNGNGDGKTGDGKVNETNETAAKTTVEFQIAIDVAGKSIDEMRESAEFMGVLKNVGAKIANTSEDAVTVSLSSARRLALRAARRLAAVLADFVVEVAEGEDAAAVTASITSQGSIESVTTLLDAALTAAGIEDQFNATVTRAVTVTNDPNNDSNQNNETNQNNGPSGETSNAAGGICTLSLLVANAAALYSMLA